MKYIFVIIFLGSQAYLVKGQDQFLNLTNCTPPIGIYHKVQIIDKRPGQRMLGFVQKGGFNRLAEVKFKGNLTDSITKFFNNPNDLSKEGDEKELVIILNELFLSEKTEAFSETGRLKLSIRLFSKNKNRYKELISIDSLYSFNSMDVTKKLLRSVSEHFCEISEKINRLESNSTESENLFYTLNELMVIDSLEKLKIPVYNTDHIHSGIYKNYEQFKNNKPDSAILFIDAVNKNNIKIFKWDSLKKKRVKVTNESIYAVCDGKHLLRANSMGFFEMKKQGNDFFYNGQSALSNSNNLAMWGAAFGLIGAAIASGAERNNTVYKFKISYLKGNSIPISIVTD